MATESQEPGTIYKFQIRGLVKTPVCQVYVKASCMEDIFSPRLAWVSPGTASLHERGEISGSAFDEIFINQKRKPHSSYHDVP